MQLLRRLHARHRLLIAAAIAAIAAAVVVGVAGTGAARSLPSAASAPAPKPSTATVSADPNRQRSAKAVGHRHDVARAPDVFVVGDSLTVGTEPWLQTPLRRAGWVLTGVDARVGRPVAEGLNVLRAHARGLPPTVLIALGTNDLGASPDAVAGWLRNVRAIVGQRRVIWVNLCLSSSPRLSGFRAINDSLRRFAPRYGVQVADWCAYAARHGIVPGPDGIHYLPSGYRARADFYARALGLAR